MGLSIYVAKTKVLISSVFTVQLICAFVFAYAKSMFSHDMAQLCLVLVSTTRIQIQLPVKTFQDSWNTAYKSKE